MCKRSNIYFAALVLFSLLRVSLSSQAYTPDTSLSNLLEMKTIVIRLSESLTLRESLLSQREQEWTVRDSQLTTRETGLNEKEVSLKEREDLIKPIENIYSDLNTSLTIALKENKVIKTALWVVLSAAIVEGIVIWLK